MLFRRWSLLLILLCMSFTASAQQDPPGRVARLSAQQGTVSFAPTGDDNWYDLVPNRPLGTGDRVWADRNTHAELQVGSAALRLDEQTLLEFSELSDDTLRITVQRGSVQVRVRDDTAGERIELDTANLAIVIGQPGQYRAGTEPVAGISQVAVDVGSAVVYGENGESRLLAAGQQLAVSGRDLTAVASGQLASSDFERWVAERNRIDDQSVAARYVSREMVGYQQLDAYGDWQNDTSYGAVWYPRNVDADWAPYREGNWVNVAPWGLTWIDSAPWGFTPSHYGRWARFGPRWGWVPGQRNTRPVYAPALVGFIGGGPRPGGGPGASGSLQIGNGRSGIGWFPLAPGEPWRPDYRASLRYIDRVNRMAVTGQPLPRPDGYANQRRPESVTVVPTDAFGRGPIGRRDVIRLPEAALAGARVGNAPSITLPPQFTPGIGRAPTGFAGRATAPPMAISPAMPAMPATQPGIAVRPQANVPPQFPQQRMPPEQVRPAPLQQDAQQRAAQQQSMQQQINQQQQAMRQAQEIQQRVLQQQQQTQQQAQQTQQRALQQQMQQQQRAEERQQSVVRPGPQPGAVMQPPPVLRDRLRPSGFPSGNPPQ